MGHAPNRKHLNLTGTVRYASINAHKGMEQSRRDDLEAIGHMLLYFVRGSLPWSGIQANSQDEKLRKIRQKKETVQLDDLCTGLPDCFKAYLSYSRKLKFKERPNYVGMRKLFRDARPEHQEHQFQWFDKKNWGTLEPLVWNDGLLQPDDPRPGQSRCLICVRTSANAQ